MARSGVVRAKPVLLGKVPEVSKKIDRKAKQYAKPEREKQAHFDGVQRPLWATYLREIL